MNTPKRLISLSLLLVLAACSPAKSPTDGLDVRPGAEHRDPVSPQLSTDPNAEAFIVTSSESYGQTLMGAQGIGTLSALRTLKDNSGQDVTILKTRVGDLSAISHTLHEKNRTCGGFMTFATQAEAESYLANERTRSGMSAQAVSYSIDQQTTVTPWLQQVSEPEVRSTMTTLSRYPNRYNTTSNGKAAAVWLRDRWLALANGRSDVTAALHTNCTTCGGQPSVILTVQGTELPNEIVVIGGHLDSISNSGTGESMQAPGADDDASGISSITEIIRVALGSGWKPKRTVQFMGYAAEETGLNGSKAIAREYKAAGKNVVGVLQLDMTNYRPAGSPIMSVLTDNTNAAQNTFMTKVFKTYFPGEPLGSTSCGYKCSDHASWTDQGYAASSMSEKPIFSKLHTTGDTLANMGNNATSAAAYARFGLAYLGELAKGSGGGGTPGNAAPVANFTSSVSGLSVNFTSTSTDSDGTIASFSWNFGDGTSSTAANPSKTYTAAGTYTVTLTVTDNAGATNTVSKTVTVSSGGTNPGPESYSGTLASGAYAFQPGSTGKTYNAGTISATLTGPSTADFDLYLQKRNADGTWSYVVTQATSATTEKVTYTATAGTYRWIVSSYSGSGSYTLNVSAP